MKNQETHLEVSGMSWLSVLLFLAGHPVTAGFEAWTTRNELKFVCWNEKNSLEICSCQVELLGHTYSQ